MYLVAKTYGMEAPIREFVSEEELFKGAKNPQDLEPKSQSGDLPVIKPGIKFNTNGENHNYDYTLYMDKNDLSISSTYIVPHNV
jgi:hypothetical protein